MPNKALSPTLYTPQLVANLVQILRLSSGNRQFIRELIQHNRIGLWRFKQRGTAGGKNVFQQEQLSSNDYTPSTRTIIRTIQKKKSVIFLGIFSTSALLQQTFHDEDNYPKPPAKNIMITFFLYEDDSPILNDEDHRGHFVPSAWMALTWRGDKHYN